MFLLLVPLGDRAFTAPFQVNVLLGHHFLNIIYVASYIVLARLICFQIAVTKKFHHNYRFVYDVWKCQAPQFFSLRDRNTH